MAASFLAVANSTRWGWIDLVHFLSNANAADAWFLSSSQVLKATEDEERKQGLDGHLTTRNSSYSYEDLPTNLLGVYFKTWLDSKEANGGDFLANLQKFFTEIGVTDDPLSKAPNAKQMAQDEKEEAGLHDLNPNNNGYQTKTRNHSYNPVLQQLH